MKQWFIIHVYSGQEYKVAQLIKEKLATCPEPERVEEVIIPTRKASKFGKKGKKEEVERKLYPGYVAIHMEPDTELFKLIASTQGVLSFGKRGKEPQPISEEEKDRMFGYIKPEGAKITETLFAKGETVKIIDGPFSDFTGTVEEIYPDKERIKLMITVFGRQTLVEVAFYQVEVV